MSGTDNNPGNIRADGNKSNTGFNGSGNSWQNTNGFLVFDTPENGFRAIVLDASSKIRKYGNKDGYISFDVWASRYAPRAYNNDPDAYAANLKQWLGKDGISLADLNDPNTAARFATAVARAEGYDKTGGTLNYGSTTGLISADPIALTGASNARVDVQAGTINEQIDRINKELAQSNLDPVYADSLLEKKQKLEATQKASGGGNEGQGRNGSSAIGGGGKGLIRDIRCNLPSAINKNPLHDYVNYSYRIILSVLDDTEYNQFVTNKGQNKSANLKDNIYPKPGSVLIASGGENLKNKNEYGVQDFYFQDLTIVSAAQTAGGSAAISNVSYAYDIDFTLIEPIGTTLFERLFYAGQGKATKTGLKTNTPADLTPTGASTSKKLSTLKGIKPESITQTVFLLTIEFKGYGKKSKPTATGVSSATFLLNKTANDGDYKVKYHIPFTFSQIDTDITSAGTTYKCKGMPAATQVFFTINQANPATTGIKENQKLSEALKELSDRYTSNQENLPKEFKKVKYVFRVADDNELTADDMELKSIARTLREQTMFRSGAPVDAGRVTFMPPKTDDQKKDGRIPGNKSGSTGFRPDKNQTFYTGIGTTAIEIINQIMLKTDFITTQVEKAREGNKNQGIWWYNIRGNMLIDEDKDNKKSPHVEKGKTFEYIIEPYKVYIMNDLDQNDMCNTSAKTFRNYEYIFTGKNNDIIRWDINFDALLYTEMQTPEPSSTTGQLGQPGLNAGQAVNASGQAKGTKNQSKLNFPTLSSLDQNSTQSNHQKLYKYNWFGINNANGTAGRVKNYPEMANASFMESLFRKHTSSQQWQLDIDIVGDPEYLSFFNNLNYKRNEKIKDENKSVVPTPKEKANRLQTQRTTGEALASVTPGEYTKFGQFLIGVKFKTPTDVDPSTLSYKGMRSADLNGVYTLATIKHMFRNGKFIQTLNLTGTDNKCCPEPNASGGLIPGGGSGGTGNPNSAVYTSLLQDKQKQLDSITAEINDPDTAESRREELMKEREQINNDIAKIKGEVVNGNAVNPYPGGYANSEFGYRTDPFTGERKFHNGMDLTGRLGDPVKAPANGTVIASGDSGTGYGNWVVIRDQYGVDHYMAHLATATPSVSSSVTVNDQIGTVGSSGRSTGPHVHYETRINNQAVNPRSVNPNLPQRK